MPRTLPLPPPTLPVSDFCGLISTVIYVYLDNLTSAADAAHSAPAAPA